MTITELITRLEAFRAEHGDLPVYSFWTYSEEGEGEEVEGGEVIVKDAGEREVYRVGLGMVKEILPKRLSI